MPGSSRQFIRSADSKMEPLTGKLEEVIGAEKVEEISHVLDEELSPLTQFAHDLPSNLNRVSKTAAKWVQENAVVAATGGAALGLCLGLFFWSRSRRPTINPQR